MTEPRRPDNIVGYVHPNAGNFSKKSIYKTFTEGEKSKGKEKFGSTTAGSHYVNYGNIVDEEEDNIEENFCPKCKEHYSNISNCVYNFKTCSKGHVWYLDRCGNIKIGKPQT